MIKIWVRFSVIMGLVQALLESEITASHIALIIGWVSCHFAMFVIYTEFDNLVWCIHFVYADGYLFLTRISYSPISSQKLEVFLWVLNVCSIQFCQWLKCLFISTQSVWSSYFMVNKHKCVHFIPSFYLYVVVINHWKKLDGIYASTSFYYVLIHHFMFYYVRHLAVES